MNAPTGKRNKQNPFFARENHVKLAKIDKNKTELFGTIGGGGGSLRAPVINLTTNGTLVAGQTLSLLPPPTIDIVDAGEPPIELNDLFEFRLANGAAEPGDYVVQGGDLIQDRISGPHPTGTINIVSTGFTVPFIADLPYDGVFTPALLATDQYGFNLTGPIGTPPVPVLTTGNGKPITGGLLTANGVSGRIDLQITGPGGALFKTGAGLTVSAINMQFDDESPFFMTDNGGVRYRNNNALVMVQYLQGKVGTPVRMRMTVQTTAPVQLPA